MSIVCSISGLSPKDPVVSDQGIVFERSEIERVLVESDSCPVTGQFISHSSLRDVRSVPDFIVPKSGAIGDSIPGHLNLFRIDMDRIFVRNAAWRSEIRDIQEEIASLRRFRNGAEELILRLRTDIGNQKEEIASLRSKLDDGTSSKKRLRT
jgi:pre-mRNA-processing factor 19